MELVLRNKNNPISGNNVFSGVNSFSGDTTISGILQGALKNAANVGEKAAVIPVVVEESGDGVHHVTKLTLTDYVIGPLDGAAAALNLIPPQALYTLPAGVQILSVSYASVGLTAEGTAVSPEIGIGSVAGDGGALATLGEAGATTEDILAGFAVADTDTHAAVASGPVGATAGIFTGIALNKAADAKTIYLNCAGTWNADNTGDLTVSGTIVIIWDTVA